MRRIGIVGSGPMAGYSLRHLIASEVQLQVTVFEADDVAGYGMPYRAVTNADEMYCAKFQLTQRFCGNGGGPQ
ncbi:FAD/NAD(P)-binding protein [Yoonia sp. MH D7]